MTHDLMARLPFFPLAQFAIFFQFVRRDLRSSVSTLFISSICITLSVFLIVLISSISQSISLGIKVQGRSILGGDVSFNTIHQDMNAVEKNWLSGWAKTSSAALSRTMGRTDRGHSTLVEVKAVDEHYPLVGDFRSSVPEPLKNIFARADGFGVTVDRELLTRLDLEIGDPLLLGDHSFQIVSVIENEPDRLSNGFGFGPRAIMSLAAAQKSGLVQDGSLTRWATKAVLFDAHELSLFLSASRAKFPDANWQVRTHEESVPSLRRSLERFRTFLIVACVFVLIIGGVGVANSVRLFVDRRLQDFAILKALGASGLFVFLLSLSEVTLIAFFFSVLGALLGAICAYLGVTFIGSLHEFPFPLEAGFFIDDIASGLLIGLIGSASFSIGSLARLRSLSTQEILRSPVSQTDTPIRLGDRALGLFGFGIAAMIAFQMLDYSKMGALLLLGAVVCVLLLFFLGFATQKLVGIAPRPKGLLARLVFTNISGPGALTRAIVMTFGLGMAALSSLLILESNIRAQFQDSVSSKSPDLFLLDIPARQAEAVMEFIRQRAPSADIDMTPMMRGRLVRINGETVSKEAVSESVAWILDGDRGITFSSVLPKNSMIVEGEWWKSQYAGEPLLSMDAEIARGLKVGIGDRITMSIMGREIAARISSLRKLEWSSLGLNFVFLFSPNTFVGAPFMQTAAVRLQANLEVQQNLVREMSQQLPHLVIIQVRETFEKLAQLTQQLRSLVLSLTLILFGLAILVLGSALAANQEMRVYAAAILVALGASRRALLCAFALEFVLLGLLAAAFGLALGAGASWLVLHNVIQAGGFSAPVGTLFGAGFAVVLIVSFMGLLMTLRELETRLSVRLKQGQ